jgi:indolepyruvate ferredoxin oxidoreductase alpha subunit
MNQNVWCCRAEAIAAAPLKAGSKVASAYPGQYGNPGKSGPVPEMPQWAQTKIALETAMGASFGGARALVVMKHVGVNVAAIRSTHLHRSARRAGPVTWMIPRCTSSQNEQDNRNYAKFARSHAGASDSQETKDFTLTAFKISEAFDTPVMLRTTRVSRKIHCGQEDPKTPQNRRLVKDRANSSCSGKCRKRHPVVERG